MQGSLPGYELTYSAVLCHAVPCCAVCISQVGYTDEFCRQNETKYWSECSVSEDFDLYIRLASSNMFGRYVM